MPTHKPKKKNQRHLAITTTLVLLCAGLFLILWKGLALNPMAIQSSQIGKMAADFQLEVLEGSAWLPKTPNEKIFLKDFRGRFVVLNFWASWCVSCRDEARELETFWQRVREQGTIVIGVAIQDTPEAAREFAKNHGKSYPIAIDSSGKTSLDYGVSGVPETFLIDKEGVIRHKETGPVTAELLQNLSLKYLANPSDPK